MKIPVILLVAAVIFTSSCAVRKKPVRDVQYGQFKKTVLSNHDTDTRTTTVLEDSHFTPGVDSLETLLRRMDTLWARELQALKSEKALVFEKSRKKIIQAELEKLDHNIRSLKQFLDSGSAPSTSTCIQNECLVFAEVIKEKQMLYLYIAGSLQDSFAVSTGLPGYETPDLDLRPAGPVLIKYNSRKFPGGNYQGLGNMPYAVFLKGGYAIHGTTQGNFSKLGRKASHGCIRLHPDNAKIFNELVKLVGLENTWVVVK